MKNKAIYIIAAVVLIIAVAIGGTVYWTSANSYVAKVGGEKITKAEYNFFLNSVKAQMEQEVQATGGDVKAFWNSKVGGEDAKEVAKNKALEEAQKIKIQMIKAKENNVTLTKEEADGIAKNIDDQVKQIGKVEADKQLKEMYNITVSEYKAIAKEMTLVQKYSSQEQQKMQPTEDDYKEAYKAIESADTVTVRHILVSTVDAEQKPLPADKQEEAKKKADDILAKVKAGGNMKDLAAQYSEDPGSKDKAGQYTFGKGEMMKEFEDWAFGAKPGDTGVVKTDYGYHVMKKPTYEELKDSIKGEAGYYKYIKSVDELKKDTKYNVVKNQKVFNSIKVA